MRSFFMALAGVLLLVNSAAVSADTRPLTINLFSSLTPIRVADYQLPSSLLGYNLYTTEFDKSGKHWYRLRVGFFADRGAAKSALAQLRHSYHGAWMAQATAGEIAATDTQRTAKAVKSAPKVVAKAAIEPVAKALPPTPLLKPTPSPAVAATATPAVAMPAATAERSPAVLPATDSEGRYVINLAVSVETLKAVSVPELAGVNGVRIYTTETERSGNHWYFLRAGFFASRAEAEALLPAVAGSYPQARVIKITRFELAHELGREIPVTQARPVKTVLAENDGHSVLLEAARLAMARNAYAKAILLYRQAIDEGDADTSRQALELLGVAEERNGSTADAEHTYRQFLKLYPEGDDADRVRQRLVALDTANAAPQAALKKVDTKPRPAQSTFYGSLAAWYRRDVDVTDADGARVSQSALTTFLDATEQVRSGAYDSKARFSGSYLKDFMQEGMGDQRSISYMYLDVLNRDADWSVRVGRQGSSGGGVLGRFDGVQGSVRLSPEVKVNAVAGYPVELFSDNTTVNSHKSFTGVSMDFSGLVPAWEFELYGIQQQAYGYLDRRAIGGEARYFQQGRTFYGLADYDLLYKQLNTLTMLGTWSVSDDTTLNAMVDRRKSPTLTTSNAVIGQTVTTLDALGSSYTTSQLRQLAADRTADSTMVSIGVSHDLNDRYQVTGDLSVSKIGATPASGGVAGTPASGVEYTASTQLIGRSMLIPDDITIVGLQWSHMETMDTAAVLLNSRFPYGSWQLNPRVQLEYHNDRGNHLKYWVMQPALLASYRRWRNHTLDLEVGGDLTTESSVPQGYYCSLGYRWDF